MNDPKVLIAIVIAVAVIVAIFILRDRITGFRGRFSRKGVHAEIKAAEPESPPATGVDLSGAQFKDHNKFTTGDDARIKAQNMKAGSGNEFQFGSSTKSAEDKESKS